MLAITLTTTVDIDFLTKAIKHNSEIGEGKFLLLFADNMTI